MDAVSDYQENGDMDAIDQIKKALEKPGKTQSGLAKAMGRYPSAVHSLLERARKLKADEIPAVAGYLEIDPSDLSGVKPKQAATETPLERNRSDRMVTKLSHDAPADAIPGATLVGERDLPVFATAQGGKGATVLSNEPVDWVIRPDPLARVKDGYGVLVTEDSMAPEFKSGDIALVNPHLAPRAGDTCVFRYHKADGEVLACIKHLRRATADLWQVSEWDNGEGHKRDFSLKRAEWTFCHVTVGKYSRR